LSSTNQAVLGMSSLRRANLGMSALGQKRSSQFVFWMSAKGQKRTSTASLRMSASFMGGHSARGVSRRRKHGARHFADENAGGDAEQSGGKRVRSLAVVIPSVLLLGFLFLQQVVGRIIVAPIRVPSHTASQSQRECHDQPFHLTVLAGVRMLVNRPLCRPRYG
jgi:hypothetical protein